MPAVGMDYAQVATALGMGQANTRAAANIRGMMHGLGSRPATGTYLGFTPTTAGELVGRLYVSPVEHFDLPGDAPSGADRATLVQSGDVHMVGANTFSEVVKLADNVMTRRAVDAPTEAHLATVVAGNANLNAGIPPEPANGADGETVRFRKLAYLPAGLAALLIGASGRSSLTAVKAIVDQFSIAQGVTLEGVQLLLRAAMIIDQGVFPAALTPADAEHLAVTVEVSIGRHRLVER